MLSSGYFCLWRVWSGVRLDARPGPSRSPCHWQWVCGVDVCEESHDMRLHQVREAASVTFGVTGTTKLNVSAKYSEELARKEVALWTPEHSWSFLHRANTPGRVLLIQAPPLAPGGLLSNSTCTRCNVDVTLWPAWVCPKEAAHLSPNVILLVSSFRQVLL